MKKAITILFIFLLSCINAMAVQSGKCGDNATWTLSNGTLTICGSGEISAFDINKTKVKRVVIEDGITAIGMSSFSFFELRNITIPNSVTTIEDMAFKGCTGLTYITIPNSVTSIGDLAFYGCEALTNVILSDSLTYIGKGAFRGCTGLKDISIPNSV
ncbi:MAG: leucine-rich repeat domain-containing protein, partial [Paludibacteraceae bacterium]|nr:leucine-rich repeat domain-containing protein [Paludibacteraceae bacterium]